MAFSHLYPWQVLTRLSGLKLSCRLGPRFDEQKLQEELSEILRIHRSKPHFGQYHDGGWGAIGLVAADGDPYEQRPLKARYAKTPVLELAPYMESVVDSLDCEKVRVRLMELKPGSNIYWHYDRSDTLAAGSVRLHVPIVTNDRIRFQISHEDCHWMPGELWYGDFSFPHRLVNEGDQSRVHLVIDCRVNEAIKKMFPPVFVRQERLGWRVRRLCQRVHDSVDFHEPRKLKGKVPASAG